MNLKTSKFYKRIQQLRRMSKDHVRKPKRIRQVDCDLENVFSERSGGGSHLQQKPQQRHVQQLPQQLPQQLSNAQKSFSTKKRKQATWEHSQSVLVTNRKPIRLTGGSAMLMPKSPSRIRKLKKKTHKVPEKPLDHNDTDEEDVDGTAIDLANAMGIEENDSHHEIQDNYGRNENNQSGIKRMFSEIKQNGFIQLNNKCFKVKFNAPKPIAYSRDEYLPSISSCKGSICVSNSRYAMIGKIAKSLGYKTVKEAKLWNLLWTDSLPGVELYKTMKRFQQINHYPGMMEICRKDLLSRNLNRMLKLFPKDYKIFPKTWIFPADYGDAMAYASNHLRKPRTFILKPDAGAQGRGIWLTNDLKNINANDRMICQTYINRPLLIDGYKFDLRVYALITSVDPLRIFVYNEGLARFATNKYVEPNPENSGDLFMHLTNYSVNKRSSQYDVCDNDECGSKRKFSAINNWMMRMGWDVDEFWGKIDDIIIKTVLSAWPMLKHNYHACFPSHDKIQACFEILGFDVLVDSKLKPYILEVNHSPSFHTNELVDRQVKRSLIQDTLCLVSTALADKKQILREDRKRVKQRLLKFKQGQQQQGDISSRSINSASTTKSQKSPKVKEHSHNEHQTVECPLCPLGQQIAWEESHLGNFRRIMPPHDSEKLNYYCQFFALQNQASIYGDTASSKKREEVSKKLRQDLEEKRIKQQELIKNHGLGRQKFEERLRKRAKLSRSVLEKHRMFKIRTQEHWTPGFISEAEERLRRTWLQMRTEVLKNFHIVQFVYLFLYRAGNLTNADILNYPQLYEDLQNGYNILEGE